MVLTLLETPRFVPARHARENKRPDKTCLSRPCGLVFDTQTLSWEICGTKEKESQLLAAFSDLDDAHGLLNLPDGLGNEHEAIILFHHG